MKHFDVLTEGELEAGRTDEDGPYDGGRRGSVAGERRDKGRGV